MRRNSLAPGVDIASSAGVARSVRGSQSAVSRAVVSWPAPSPGRKPIIHGLTLIEMLCVIAVIGVLAALVLPALSRGQAHARRVRCASNLHHMGLSFIEFAHLHNDKFPIQVSTNQGGSFEFLNAGRVGNSEFCFFYRHFLPVAAELSTPNLLVCPADTRLAATNFALLRNENLSYFVGATPRFARSDSIPAGDRNIKPLFESRPGARRLTWTREMHENKGNVLFADGHVEELKGVLNLTNRLLNAPARPSATGY